MIGTRHDLTTEQVSLSLCYHKFFLDSALNNPRHPMASVGFLQNSGAHFNAVQRVGVSAEKVRESALLNLAREIFTCKFTSEYSCVTIAAFTITIKTPCCTTEKWSTTALEQGVRGLSQWKHPPQGCINIERKARISGRQLVAPYLV